MTSPEAPKMGEVVHHGNGRRAECVPAVVIRGQAEMQSSLTTPETKESLKKALTCEAINIIDDDGYGAVPLDYSAIPFEGTWHRIDECPALEE